MLWSLKDCCLDSFSETMEVSPESFNSLRIINRYRTNEIQYILVELPQRCIPTVSGALTSLDPSWGRSIHALAMSSLSNSSKPRTSCGRVGLGLAGHGCLAPSSNFVHETRAGGRWDALTVRGSEQQLESEISQSESAIATPLAISPNSTMPDSGRIVTPVA